MVSMMDLVVLQVGDVLHWIGAAYSEGISKSLQQVYLSEEIEMAHEPKTMLSLALLGS